MPSEDVKVLILAGGSLNAEFVKKISGAERFHIVIAADKGLLTAHDAGILPDYIVGDFDSVTHDVLEKYKGQSVIKEFPPEKNFTDTHLAIEEAIKLGADSIVILGATGTRIDHTMANISLLLVPFQNNIKAMIIDEHNKIYLTDSAISLRKEKLYGPFLSLLPYTDEVKGVTLQGFKYPLLKKDMKTGDSLGISNEVQEEMAVIQLEQGILIVIEAKD